MKIKTERDKQNYLIIALCAILVVMGVGYAAFSSLLTINGTANISNSWCVGFDSTLTSAMDITKGLSTGTQPTGSMEFTGTACETNYKPNANLEAHFYQPGDQIEYTLTIVNKSTVTAAIKSFTINGNENITSNWTHTDGNITYTVNMPADTTLDSNETTTMTVIAKFQNETAVTGNVKGETKTLSVSIDVQQDDGNGGIITNPTYTGVIYRWSTTALANKDSDAQSNYPITITNLTKGTDYITEADYSTYSQRVTILGKQYYLKHDVVNDEIINSYVCFVYNSAEQCMKGADGGVSFDVNTGIIQDYQTFYNLSTVSNPSSSNPGCFFYSSYSNCYSGELYRVYANSVGASSVYGSNSERCSLGTGGSSICAE